MSSTTLNGASEVFTSTATINGNPPPTTQQSTSSPKEIGWWFVESYYTTLNGSPERLHLFYQKKSSFVWGLEGENVAVSHGRNEISERIKQLAFNDCKVRVTNVDSQGSLDSGIIVQVIGDMINNSESSQRFAQTFFLAEQTNPRGYFVLNDIFRYLKDEEEEEETAEAAPEETAEAPVDPAPEVEPVAEEKEPEVEAKEEPEEPEPEPVPEKEEVKEEVKEEAEKVEEAPVEPVVEKVEEPAVVAPVTPAVPVVPAVPVIPTPQPETTEPEPTPEAPATVTEPVKETPAPPPVPQEPPKPAKPASWAALLASKTTPTPTAPVATQPVAPAATPTTTPAANTNANAPAPTATPGPSSQANSGWQTTESRRQNRPVSISGAPQNAGSAYVKGVTDKVSQRDLKAALEKFGTVNNVEIVLERKCAFVEFADGAALFAAAKENPHRINGQIIYVEERRPRPANYGGPRGGGSNLRGGERQGSRGGSQRGPGDRDRFDTSRNSIGGGRGQGGNVRGGGQYSRGGRGGAAASSN
ncbi:uncharacterized protein DFL_001944 [Arthrobotrys flagrans]|uniref:NTF2 domain-containing protein n=1 Tax=Arthrobotrys flagrans TaxID=97331 RepID=A0A437A9B3_ARTFL|nr:hypothetical protein DFL_001944 [Arthrobotrys flagrans]